MVKRLWNNPVYSERATEMLPFCKYRKLVEEKQYPGITAEAGIVKSLACLNCKSSVVLLCRCWLSV
jgi:hypothetical protein